MTTDARIPLREAAIRLAGYPRFRKTNTRGRRELHRLLQTDQVGAAFDFPSKARPRIDIAGKFWADTKSGDFDAQLVSHSRRGKHGQFLVGPVEFVDQYASWFSDEYLTDVISAEKRTSADAELASALANMRKKREAYILQSEWDRFVRASKLDVERVDELPPKSTKGKHALTSWDVVLTEVAVELLSRQARGGRLDEHSQIAAIALTHAQKKLAKNNPAPKIETIAKKIAEIVERIDELSSDDVN